MLTRLTTKVGAVQGGKVGQSCPCPAKACHVASPCPTWVAGVAGKIPNNGLGNGCWAGRQGAGCQWVMLSLLWQPRNNGQVCELNLGTCKGGVGVGSHCHCTPRPGGAGLSVPGVSQSGMAAVRSLGRHGRGSWAGGYPPLWGRG